ncbi:MAG: glycosyltransferase family 39 protein [Myxococcales bacterium]|nr:glycosyltransferase family 39 protein [Myxococcales bacterium]
MENSPAPLLPAPRAAEWLIIALMGAALFLPGLGRYSLVDPWETHYAEVARRMVADDDYVRTQWSDEGFRSKPVLTFWLMSASMHAAGVGGEGAYDGEMAATDAPTRAVRLPFAICGLLGLLALWYSLRRTVGRPVAWAAFAVVATSPFYLLVARQAITDMTMVAALTGAIAAFVLAQEAGETPLPTRRVWRWHLHAGHVALALLVAFTAWQAYLLATYPSAHATALRQVSLGGSRIEISVVLRTLAIAMMAGLGLLFIGRRVTTVRQLAMLVFFALLGVSILGKGLPAFGVAGLVAAIAVLTMGRWRRLFAGDYELWRGFLLVVLIAVPWHYGMYAAEGPLFYSEYVGTHLLGRAFSGVFGERGTFVFYIKQLGLGLFPWIALVPFALGMATRLTLQTREHRVMVTYGIWAAVAVAFFAMVQTKFHHYILPAVPPLGVLIAWSVCQAWQARRALPLILVGIGGAWAVLVANDLMADPAMWIEMFVFRFDRPWPLAAPWSIDPSDRIFAVGLLSLVLLLIAGLVRRAARPAIAAFFALAIAQAGWLAHGYMKDAGTHWGMRDAMRAYYAERDIYGAELVYFSPQQLAREWQGRTSWTLPTVVPAHVTIGQPMAIRIALRGEGAQQWVLPAHVVSLSPHAIDLQLVAPALADQAFASWHAALAKGQQLLAARTSDCVPATRKGAPCAAPAAPIRLVDASRLLAWALYWRGEHFWTSDVIYGPLPSYQTSSGQSTEASYLTNYLSDPSRATAGRTYFILSEARHAGTAQGAMPTDVSKATFRKLNTDSNKFTLSMFTL